MKEDIASQLERIAKLHASGALSDEEFTQAKVKILGASEDDSSKPAYAIDSVIDTESDRFNFVDNEVKKVLPPQFQHYSQDDDIGRAANRWVSLQTVMAVIGVVLFCIMALVMCSKMNEQERKFEQRWNNFPGR